LALHDAAERLADLVHRLQRHLRHLEQDPVAGELRQRCGGTAETDVQQLDERVLLDGSELHQAAPPSAEATASSNEVRSIGLFRNPAAPPACASSRDEFCTSADTTITRAAPSISVNFFNTSRPVMPFIT